MESLNEKQNNIIPNDDVMDNPELFMELEDDLCKGIIDQERFDFLWEHRNEF